MATSLSTFQNEIKFFSTLPNEYQALSNFWITPVLGYRTPDYTSMGFFTSKKPELFASAEHFYASEKYRPDFHDGGAFPNTMESWRQTISLAESPGLAHALANKHSSRVPRSDWETRKLDVLRMVLWQKFANNQGLRKKLGFSAPARLIEENPFDPIFGVGSNGKGQNRMGIYLEQLRYKLLHPKAQLKVLIGGDSKFYDFHYMFQVLDSLFKARKPDEIICGCEPGADSLGEVWAIQSVVGVKHFMQEDYGSSKKSKELKVSEMVDSATHAIVFSNPKNSAGTRLLLKVIESRKIPCRVVMLKP